MTIEQQLREQLERATQDVPIGPDLSTSLTLGRTRRRRRTGLVAGGGAVAAAAVGALVLVTALGGTPGDGGTQVATDPTSSAPTAGGDGDFVSGTDVDEMLASAVTRHLPSLGTADDIYPSDWDHAGPMPDADHADATDWQAAYTVGPDDQLLVFMGYPPPGEKTDPGVVGEKRYQSDADKYTFYSSYVADSGFTVNALETVVADSWQSAAANRAFTKEDLLPLVKDPELIFPLPASRR